MVDVSRFKSRVTFNADANHLTHPQRSMILQEYQLGVFFRTVAISDDFADRRPN